MKPQIDITRENPPLNLDGSFKTKKDMQISAIRERKKEDINIVSPHPDSHIFDSYLNSYQEDVNRIVGKFRYSFHLLSHEELVSEVNLSLVKKRDEILSTFDGDFTEVNFKKLAYRFTRNVIKWTNWGAARSPYVGKRIDLQHLTEDGFKSTYEVAIETNGYDDDFYENFDRNEKCSYLLKMIREYSSILTDKEIKVLSFLEKGLTQYEIAEHLGVTHQAISLLSIKIFDKIKARFSSDVISDTSYNDVSKGHKAISDFFNPEDKNTPLRGEDRENLKSFLLQNIKAYTPKEVSTTFMKGKYSHRQIISFAIKNKLTFCLILKDSVYKFSKDEVRDLLILFNKGASSRVVSDLMKIPLYSVIGKKSHLSRTGKLTLGKKE